MFKKVPAFLLLVFVFFSVSKAQDIEYDNNIHLGFKIGMNSSSLTKNIGPFDRNTTTYANSEFAGAISEYHLSFHVGVTADYNITNTLSIATELTYSGRGSEYSIDNNKVMVTDTDGNQSAATNQYTYSLWYFEIPLMLRYDLASANKNQSYMIYSGISSGINIVHRANYTYYTQADNGIDVDTHSQTISLSNVRHLIVSPVIGFCSGRKLDKQHTFGLFYDVRYEYTPSPVFNISNLNSSNFQTAMWTFSFGVGIRF